ncbi:FAD-dependent monooxygenase [Rubrobacter aplysinae]|uniref:FAD-dependent monooxygenase n=1 Tax=Rubrobacter aplysinae TaxID=909625 RepID=UPI00069E9122|nr:FAD-dependent monooxygenase [Rubrobacter aplysinae]
MTTTDVLIVGAGPTGLTAANVLQKSRVEFRIVDKTSGPVKESRALGVQAKTLELFDKLGLADRAVEEGQRIGAAEMLKRGRPVGKLSFFEDDRGGRSPYPFALIYEQNRIERLLIQGLEESGGGVEWGTELLSATQTPGGATAAVRRPDGSEETIEAGWVIAADGAGSPIRHSLGLSFEGGTYEETLFLADVELEWELDPHRLYLDLTSGGFYAFFPMPGKNRFRIVGGVPENLEGKEAFTSRDIQDLLDRHSGVQTRVTATHWSSVYKIHRRMTERFRVGHTFLAGDAAHIHSPAGAQGMNTGIGDAYNLAWKLALVTKGEARESLLDSYEAERMPFARAILNGSDRGFSLQVTKNPLAKGAKLFVLPLLFRLVSAVPPLSRRAFWFVSQLWTQYRESPAVSRNDSASRGPRRPRGPKAGERVPYGFFESGAESGESIFESLRGTDHHLLLFEGETPDGAHLDAAREELESLLGRYEFPVHVHQVDSGNRQLHRRYGLRGPELFLIRPDGHIAYRGRVSDIVGLKLYLDRFFLESRDIAGRSRPQTAGESLRA